MDVLIVTGMSGSGKSVVANSLEDYGYFCIDNLPAHLVGDLVSKLVANKQNEGLGVGPLAIVVDSRSKEYFSGFAQSLKQLQENGISYKILFLEASDDVIMSRYKQSRRNHPLAKDQGIAQGIRRERELLEPLLEQADQRIKTDYLSPKDLSDKVFQYIHRDDQADPSQKLSIVVQSFGFKYGMPEDCDSVVDVRFLPNPYYVDTLRPLSGQDQEIRDYVYHFPETRIFMDKQLDLFLYLLPYYIREGKFTFTIGVGCTGGRHRSVLLAEDLSRSLREAGYRVTLVHRDIAKDLQKTRDA